MYESKVNLALMGLMLRKYVELREMDGMVAQRGRSLISMIALLYWY